jgi:hypothetical protein
MVFLIAFLLNHTGYSKPQIFKKSITRKKQLYPRVVELGSRHCFTPKRNEAPCLIAEPEYIDRCALQSNVGVPVAVSVA